MAGKTGNRRLPTDLKNASDLVKFTERHWDDLDPLFGFWSKRWQRTIEFIRSQHWNTLKKWKLEEVPKWRRYPTIGLMLSVYNDQLRHFLQSQVRYSAIPASADPADIGAAELAAGALKYTWGMLEMDAAKIDLGAWLLATGNGALRTYWDTDTGNLIPLAIRNPEDETGQALIPINPQTMQPDPTMKEPVMVDAGELGVDVMNPQLVRYPRSKKDGVMVGLLLTADEFEQKYGPKLVEEVSFSKIDTSVLTDLSFSEMPGLTVGSGDMDRALCVEHYIPRSKALPKGGWWTVANSRLITPATALPGGEVPISQFRWVPIPGSRMGGTPLYDITYSNKMYDEIQGKIQEWAAKVMPKRLLKEGGGIDIGQFDGQPGQEVLVNVGGEPEWDTPPEVPQQLFNLLDVQARDIRTVGGYDYDKKGSAEVKGQAQGGRAPHRQKDQESSASLLEIMSKPSWEHHARVIIGYIKKFYNKDRMLGIVGKDKQFQWLDFSQVELERMPAAIQVDEMPLFASNRQATRDTVIGLMSTPAANVVFSDIGPDGQPKLDKDRISNAMSGLGIDVDLATLDPDIAEARNEHAFILQGEQVQVKPFQDHVLHVSEHELVMKSITYRSWPEEAQKGLQGNVDAHNKILSEGAEQQRQAAIQQEREMREVRETAEMQANVKEMMAEMMVENLGDIVKSSLKEVLGDDGPPAKKKPAKK